MKIDNMKIDEMRKAIMVAVENNEVSMRELGHPGTIRRIIDGLDVKEESIQSAYSKLKVKSPNRIKSGRTSSVRKGLKEPHVPIEQKPIAAPIEQEPVAPIEQNAPIVSAQYVSIEEFESLKKEIDYLKEQIKQGQFSRSPRSQVKDTVHKDTVLGFSICIYSTWTDGNKYEKYYGTKRIKGKLHRIYLGNRPEDAEIKIVQYCTKHNIELKESVEQ